MEEGYTVHLANPCAIKQYLGLKYIDDKHDAFWRAISSPSVFSKRATSTQRSNVP